MIDILFIWYEGQVNCDKIRMRFIEDETMEDAYARAQKKVAKHTGGKGKISHLGI